MAKNISITVDGDIMKIEIDLAKDFGKSKSGKTLVVASSEGNVPVPDHPNMRLGINVYKYSS
ncbi:MAG: hypothetical protein WCX65_05515 [bacterium]